MVIFRKIGIEISRANGYGQYYLTAKYKGKEIKVHTTNNECFDWLNDDNNKKKHIEAKRYAYHCIINKYKTSI